MSSSYFFLELTKKYLMFFCFKNTNIFIKFFKNILLQEFFFGSDIITRYIVMKIFSLHFLICLLFYMHQFNFQSYYTMTSK